MTRTTIPIGALLAAVTLAAPAGAAAAPAERPAVDDAKPAPAERSNAAKRCRIERGTTPAENVAFGAAYGTGPRKRNAFGRCVSRHARDAASERRARLRRAIRACRRELAHLGPELFRAKYGDGGASPFRNCVRAKLDSGGPPVAQPDAERTGPPAEPGPNERRTEPPSTPAAERPDRAPARTG